MWRRYDTFSVGGAFPALAALNHHVQRIPRRLAHDVVIELLGYILIAEGKAWMGLEEHNFFHCSICSGARGRAQLLESGPPAYCQASGCFSHAAAQAVKMQLGALISL